MESHPNNRNLTNEDLKRESRRNFLKGAAAGIGVAALGAMKAIDLNKDREKANEADKFLELFKGKEENLNYATKAMSLLIHEMQLENIARVKTYGTGHPNVAISFLRDFITRHLKSKISSSYSSAVKGLVDTEGYTEQTLLMLIGEANNTMNGQANNFYNSQTQTYQPQNSGTEIDTNNQKKFQKPSKNIL